MASNSSRPDGEADLVRLRLGELYEQPIRGDFDLAHLKAVHTHIFQDLPHHKPGVVRDETREGWIKNRNLEGQSAAYSVHYASKNVEPRIAETLRDFGGTDALKDLKPDIAAARLAKLYGDLDHAHGFYEGNSRTLREFTRELAEAAGYTLDWFKSSVGVKERNELYIARDVAVLERAFPGLTTERAMQTDSRAEYEAWCNLGSLRQTMADRSLEAIIRSGLSQDRAKELPEQNGPEPQEAPSDDPASWTKEERAARVTEQIVSITAEEQAKANDQTNIKGRSL